MLLLFLLFCSSITKKVARARKEWDNKDRLNSISIFLATISKVAEDKGKGGKG